MNKKIKLRIIYIMLVISMLFANFNFAFADSSETITFTETGKSEDIKFSGDNIEYFDGYNIVSFKIGTAGIYAIEVYDADGTKLQDNIDYEFSIVGGVGENDTSETYMNALCGVPSNTECEIGITNKGTGEYKVVIECLKIGDDYESSFLSTCGAYEANEVGELQEELGIEIDESGFRKIEKIMSKFLILVAKSANWMLACALNKTLTIDDIVFNSYDEIRLDYFNFGIDGKPITSNSSLINALKTPINTCYSFFTKIAILGYVIVLVYLGIQILLNSTSADKKASAKNSFMYWVTGVVILFFYPYAMKYIILAEDAFVKDIGAERSYTVSTTELITDGNNADMTKNVDDVITYTDDETADYMSRVGAIAQETKTLSISVAYLILTWQLIMLVVYYYKRAFTVAFLIMVFPLVALTYIFDKLNDGKSQALSAWTREFVIDVVIQVFHAVVYVFVANTIYATINSNMDNILIMIAATFMFEGENIMKQIFGGGKTVSTGSPAQNGAKIAALAGLGVKTAFKTAKAGVKGINGVRKAAMVPFDLFRPNKDKRLTLKESLAKRSKTYQDMRDWKNRWDLMRNFDAMSENENRDRRIAKLLPSSGDITQNINDTAEAIVDINNGATDKDVADALYKLQELLKKRKSPNGMTENEKKQFDAMLRASHLSVDQLENIQAAMHNASAAVASSPNPDYKTISQNLKLTVEYSFSNLDDEQKKRMTNRVFAGAMYNLRNGYLDREAVEEGIKDNWEEKRENIHQFGKNIRFRIPKKKSEQNTKEMQKAAEGFKRELASKIKNFDTLPEMEKKKIRQVGESLSYLLFNELDQPDELREHAKVLKQNFGVNQQFMERFIKSYVNLDDVQKAIDNGGYSVRGAQLIRNRAEGLKQQYLDKHKDELPKDFDTAKLDESAEYYAKLELLGSGEISAFEACEAFQHIDLNDEISKNLLKISNLDSEIDSVKYMIAKAMLENQQNWPKDFKAQDRYKDAMSWAKETVDTMENMDHNPNETDPVASIYDIINAAKIRGGGKVGSTEDLYRNSSSDGMVNSKVDATFEAGKKLGKKILGGRVAEYWKEKSFMANDDGDNQSTVLGYTYADLVKMQDIEISHKAKEEMETFSDLTVKPTAAFLGAMIGMALSDDGMPLGEGVTGMIAGATVADKLTESVSDFATGDSRLQSQRKEIMSQVNKRLKKEEKERLKARQAFAEAAASADDSDKVVKINYVSANYYKNADDEGHVTLNIIADNATWMSIGEPNYIGGWIKYEENYDYTLKNPKTNSLFIRLKDDSGNMVKYDIKLDNPDA